MPPNKEETEGELFSPHFGMGGRGVLSFNEAVAKGADGSSSCSSRAASTLRRSYIADEVEAMKMV